jgi:hypothetical protein
MDHERKRLERPGRGNRRYPPGVLSFYAPRPSLNVTGTSWPRSSSSSPSLRTDCEMAMTEADSDKAHAAAFDAIQSRVRAHVNQKCFVVFSGYKCDQDNVPIDNLDEVPISGNVKIRASRERLASGNPKKDYESEVFENPTWLDLCAIANAHLVQRVHRREIYLKEWPAPWFQGFGLFFSAGGLGASFARHSAAFSGLSHAS